MGINFSCLVFDRTGVSTSRDNFDKNTEERKVTTLKVWTK